MRTTSLLLPFALTTLASMPIAAQDAPRVIFCSGPCFAVDANGIRTPAPKGTELRPGQRLETGPDAYAQLKLGPNAALGVGESAQVRFDQSSVRDRDVVILDQGRVRMVGGEAIGRPETRTLELRTTDGAFAMRGADVEAKTLPPTERTGSSLTVVKLNAGDLRLINPQGDIPIGRDPQGFTAGKRTDKIISPADIAPPRSDKTGAAPRAQLPALPPIALAPPRGPTLPVLTPPTMLGFPLSYIPQPTRIQPVPSGERLAGTPIRHPETGLPTTLPVLLRPGGFAAGPRSRPGITLPPPSVTPAPSVFSFNPGITFTPGPAPIDIFVRPRCTLRSFC